MFSISWLFTKPDTLLSASRGLIQFILTALVGIWGNWGTGKLDELPEFTQLVNVRAGVQSQEARFPTLHLQLPVGAITLVPYELAASRNNRISSLKLKKFNFLLQHVFLAVINVFLNTPTVVCEIQPSE